MASIGCEILPYVDPTTQNGPPGATLTYRFQITPITGGCAGTVSGTVLIGSDTTAGSTPSPTSWSGAPNAIITISVLLANSPGGNAAYTIDCPAGQCNGGNSTIAINARVDDSYSLAATPATTSFVVRTGQTLPLAVRYLVSGSASTLNTTWTVDSVDGNVGAPTVTPDVNGDAATYFFSYTPGTYNVTVAGECPISVAAPNCPPPTVSFQIVVERPVLSIVTPPGGNATIRANTPTTLKIKFSGPTLPVADGTNIQWNVLTQPPLGDGTLIPASGPPTFYYTSTTGGFSQVDFQASVPGNYTVQACYAPDGCSSTDLVTFTITVVPAIADLSITKSASPEPVGSGAPITYSIVVANAGPDDAATVVMSDPLPPEVVFRTLVSSPGWSCTTPAIGSSGLVSCSNPLLASGASSTFTIAVRVAPGVPGGSTISNSADVSSQTFDPSAANDSASALTTLSSAPALRLVKVLTGSIDNDNSGTITLGDQLDYTVTATNSGNVELTNVVLSDDHFPATATCSSLLVGADCVLLGSYTVQSTDVSTGSVTNVGSARSAEVPGPVTASVVTPIGGAVTPAPAMTVAKVLTGTVDNDSSGSITAGDRLDYGVTATNTGNVPLGNVLVSDDHFAATTTCASVPVNGTCVLTGSYVVQGSDTSAGSVTNIGSATSTEVPGPVTSSVTTAIIASPVPSMTVAKLLTGTVDNDSSGSVSPGDRLDYSVTASNNGNVPLGNVVVSDDHFATTTTCASVPVSGTCVLTGSYTVQASDASAGSVTNIGSATSTQVPGPITSSVNTPISPAPAPAMTVTKLLAGSADNDASGSVTPGDRLDYSVTARNTGNLPLGNVVVSDNHFTAINTCASVPVNGTCVLTGSYVVQASDASAGSVTNIGSASSTQIPGPITSSVNTPVSPAPAPAMTVTKLLTGSVDNDSSGSVTPGDRLDYSVTARNTGNVPLGNVMVSDNHFAATTSCASLAVNATCVLTGSYTVAASDATAGSINNIGSAASTQVPGPITSSVLTTVNPPVNRTLSIVSGNNQFGAPGTPLALPLVVRALNNSAAAAGVVTNWTVTIGNASLGGASVTTNAAGEASNSLTLGPAAGPVTVRVSRADAPTVIVVFGENAAELEGLTGLDDNQRAIADVLDTICPQLPASSSDPKVNDLRQRCQDLFRAIGSDPAGVADALDQLFTDVALMQSELGFLAAQAQFDNIKARIAALRSGTRGTSFGGLALSTGSGRIPLGTMWQNMLDGDAPKEVGADFSRWGFFASGTIGRGNADAGSLSPSYDFDINGLTVGADYRKSDKLIFGGSLGYSKQDSDLTGGLGKLEASGWSASAYGTYYQADSWYSDAVLSLGRNTYMTERRLHYSFTLPGGATTTIDQQGKGDSSGDSLSFAASFGRDFNKGGWGFGPYFRAMYTKLSFDQVNEKLNGSVPGSGLALSIDARDVTSLSSTLGGKLTYAHSASWGVMIPHLQLEWQHEFKTDPAAVEAHFLYDPTATPFTIHGDEVDSDFFRFGVGMSFVMTHGRSGFFYYERLISRERFSQNSLAFGLRLEF